MDANELGAILVALDRAAYDNIVLEPLPILCELDLDYSLLTSVFDVLRHLRTAMSLGLAPAAFSRARDASTAAGFKFRNNFLGLYA